MNKSQLADIFARIAASYTRRELDRRAYDRLMASPVGQRLARLGKRQKYALEFIAYAATAVLAGRKADAGALRTYVIEVVNDAPSEIAKRMINGCPTIDPVEIKKLMSDLTDDQLELLVDASADPKADSVQSFSSQSANRGDNTSALARLADKIEVSRRKIRQRRESKR